MNKDTKNILVAGCALLLPFLFKKDKNTSSSIKNDLSRFNDYPNGSGEFGGGYYDKQTKERIQEQAKKDSPLYFGDKSQNSIYDPFYDFNGSPVQANGVTERNLSATDYETAAKCVRVRIVPNSFFVSNTFTKDLGKLKENHIYACMVEIFNPFPFAGYDNPNFKIDIEQITLESPDKGNQSTQYDLTDRKIFVTGRHYNDTNTWNVSYNPGSTQNLKDLQKGIETGIFEFYKKYNDNEGIYEDMPNSLPGGTSIYLPVFLSFVPNQNGDVTKLNTMRDNILFYQYNSDHTETTGIVAGALEKLEFTILLKVNDKQRLHTVIASAANDSYSFNAEKSVSVSHQDKKYFSLDSTPIYQRNDFWTALFGQRTLDFSTRTGGAAARSYWWNYTRIRKVEQFAPFGSIDIKLD